MRSPLCFGLLVLSLIFAQGAVVEEKTDVATNAAAPVSINLHLKNLPSPPEETSLRGSEVVEAEAAKFSTKDDPTFAYATYYENSDCTGFKKYMSGVLLDQCVPTGGKYSYRVKVTSDDVTGFLVRDDYNGRTCSGTPTSTDNEILSAPLACTSASGLYVQATSTTDLPTDADFAGGVRMTVYDSADKCALDQDPSDSGYRRNLPAANVKEVNFATLGYCWGANGKYKTDVKFTACDRGVNDVNTFTMLQYASTDGSCSGAPTKTYKRNKRSQFCKRSKDTWNAVGYGYASWTCF